MGLRGIPCISDRKISVAVRGGMGRYGEVWGGAIAIGKVAICESGIRLHANSHRFGGYSADLRHHQGRNGESLGK